MESREENTSWYLTVNGSRVEVTEEVYRAWKSSLSAYYLEGIPEGIGGCWA